MAEPALDPTVIETLRQLSEPGGPDVVEEVFAIFLEETPKRLDDIDAAMEMGNEPGPSAGAFAERQFREHRRPRGSTPTRLDDEARDGRNDRLESLVAAVAPSSPASRLRFSGVA